MMVVMMTAMLDDHELFRAGAVPAALGIAHLADAHMYASVHLAALTAQAHAALTALVAAHTFAALASNFDPALCASALAAHVAAAL